jgi:hypothetical protein
MLLQWLKISGGVMGAERIARPDVRGADKSNSRSPASERDDLDIQLQNASPTTLMMLQRTLGNQRVSRLLRKTQPPAPQRKLTPVKNRRFLQLWRVGYIPNAAWRANNIPAHGAYQGISLGNGIADFDNGTKTAILNANRAHYTANAHPNPLMMAHNQPPLSDHSAAQLWPTSPEIDHAVPVTELGSNDSRNARVLSDAENKPGQPVPRTNANERDVIALEAEPFFTHRNRGDVLTAGDINTFLTNAGSDTHVVGIANVDSNVIRELANLDADGEVNERLKKKNRGRGT